MSEDEAREALRRRLPPRRSRPIALTRSERRDDDQRRRSPREPELDAALDEALEASAPDRVLARLGLRDGPELPLTYRLAPVRAAELANRIDERFGDPPEDAQVVVTDDAIRVVDARAGTAVDRRRSAAPSRRCRPRSRSSVVEAGPVVTTEEAERAAARIERLLDGHVASAWATPRRR